MEDTLQQVYKLEKEFMENKQKLQQFHQAELTSIQSKKILDYSLEVLEEKNIDKKKIFQPLGKCYLRRDPVKLREDIKFVLEKEAKNLEENKKMKNHYQKLTLDANKQLIEMTKDLKVR